MINNNEISNLIIDIKNKSNKNKLSFIRKSGIKSNEDIIILALNYLFNNLEDAIQEIDQEKQYVKDMTNE